AGIDIDDVVLPVGVAWTPRHDPALLGGVTVIECEARALPADGGTKALYRPARAAGTPFRLRMIPYFAWCNRGPGDMSVWLPAGR
ncbi:MAG: glycoside hydrolase family 127 protein, partial [Verrucomicrobia bacterium]|nr:glycoside hydrolase family 127 protein [Verrucomicrobiota bacterium]